MANGKRVSYHVTWRKRGGGWQIKEAGGSSYGIEMTKKEAITFGRRLGRLAHPQGQLIVHNKDGRISAEYTYGNDPRRTKG